jgi:hypothetical protein
MDDLESGKPESDRAAAAEALRSIGPNAVPFLLEWIRTPETIPEWKLKLAGWMSRSELGRKAMFHLRFVVRTGRPRLSALAFGALGESGAAAVPELTALLSDEQRSFLAAEALSGIGGPAIPAGLRALRDSDPRLRILGTQILGAAAASPEVSVPALLEKVSDTNGVVRESAIRSLREFGTNAVAAFPTLDALLQSNWNQIDAAYALSGMGDQAILPLLKSVTSTNRSTRAGALAALTFPESIRQFPNSSGGKLNTMLGKQALFNNVSLRIAWQMYGAEDLDRSNSFDPIFLPYLKASDPRMVEAASNGMNVMRQLPRAKTRNAVVPARNRANE